MNNQIEAQTASGPMDWVSVAAAGPRRSVAKPIQATAVPILFFKVSMSPAYQMSL